MSRWPPWMIALRNQLAVARKGGDRIPVRRATAMVKQSTRASREISLARGRKVGLRRTSARAPTQASPMPHAAPIDASNRLSVRSWRTSRARPAPRELRMPISRRRTEDRDNSRLATFTQAIRRTKPTAAAMVSIAGRMLPVMDSCRPMIVVSQPALEPGKAAAARAAITLRSFATEAAVTPGRRRATPWR